MKTSRYFDLRVKRNRPEITVEMCEYVVANAEREEQQGNGFFQFWGYFAEADKWLRVITEEDRETLHNAFFDSGYTRKRRRE